MYLGRYPLGWSVPLFLVTTTATGVPTEPNDVPDMIVWSGDTAVLRLEMPVIERRTQPGTFFRSLFLGYDYQPGNYCVEYRWVLPSGYIGSAEATFEVVPSGHADGSVVAAYFYSRPGTNFLVHQVERGALLPGKNPSI